MRLEVEQLVLSYPQTRGAKREMTSHIQQGTQLRHDYFLVGGEGAGLHTRLDVECRLIF